jgi:integrase
VRITPYYMRLAKGAYLGFRRGPDTWLARYRDRKGTQHHKALGPYLEFDDARSQAEEWIAQFTGSTVRTIKRATVRQALEAYIADLRRSDRFHAALQAEQRCNAHIWDDPLAGVELERLTQEDLLEWRDRVRKGRLARSINRYVATVVAGLNRALELGYVGNRSSWKIRQLPDDAEDEGTAVFLTPPQRRLLIACAEPHAAAFFRGLEFTGARPKELAATRVQDLDASTLRLAHRKGQPPKLRVRHTVLSADGREFFRRQAADKDPLAHLFAQDGGRPWDRYTWSEAFRAAAQAVNDAQGSTQIPRRASCYSFRHARISELLQVHSVDPLTVAQQTGTSLAMIEKAYHRFIPAALQEKLAAVRDSL